MREQTAKIVSIEGRRSHRRSQATSATRRSATRAVAEVVETLGGVDILVNNAGEQHPDEDITDITEEQLRRTFQTNIFGMFFLTQAARPHLKAGVDDHQLHVGDDVPGHRRSCSIIRRPRARSRPSPARSPKT